MSDPEKLIHVGTVGKPHGVRGEVKVIPETDEPERLEQVETLFVGASAGAARPLVVEGFRYQHTRKGLTLLLKFGGYDSPEAVSVLRRNEVLVREQDFPMDADEVLAQDLVGFEVVSEDGSDMGTVTDVLDLPAHLVYQVTRPNGTTSLVPAVEEFVRSIDVDARRITVSPIEGLFE